MKIFIAHIITACALMFLTAGTAQAQQRDFIYPACEQWLDVDGNHIQAHGGGVIKIEDTYYWYASNADRNLTLIIAMLVVWNVKAATCELGNAYGPSFV
jgi:hypothetical protein